MKRQLSPVFWWEAAGTALSAGLFIATLINREWIEAVFGIDPDAGSGALEWVIVTILAVATLGSLTLVRREWRRAQHP